MKCAWQELLMILPQRLRGEIDRRGKETLQEVRLRVGQRVELILSAGSEFLTAEARPEDLSFAVNAASRYSPWSAESASEGYITAPGGHRIGLCGECAIHNGIVQGIRAPTALCIRVAREHPGIGNGVPLSGSMLILGPPGSGKTTLLREIIRRRSQKECVAVVDERGELFPLGGVFDTGPRTDVLTGCRKIQGIQLLLKTMGPSCIAVDEITSKDDCDALISGAWCGVSLVATAHAADVGDLRRRKVYGDLAQRGIFDQFLVLRRDKSWHLERSGYAV